ncbi:TniQ family protein [Aquabacterium sp.]|uniref:TniQ family protein n=1 Tax=Aquabacterium sp. TaxID=1872578 RepID=UPI0034508E8D
MGKWKSFHEYAIRPEPVVGESLYGYCWRFYTTNGHQLPPHIRAACIAVRRGQHSDFSSQAFKYLFGMDRIAGLLSSERNAFELIRRFGVSKWFHWWNRGRFCSRCVEEMDVHLLRFDLPHINACPSHEIELISQCSNCTATLSWGTLAKDWRCQCGMPIAAMRTSTAVEAKLQLCQWLLNGRGPRELDLNKLGPTKGLLARYRSLWLAGLLRQTLLSERPVRMVDEWLLGPISTSVWDPTKWDRRIASQSVHMIGARAERYRRRLSRRIDEKCGKIVRSSMSLSTTYQLALNSSPDTRLIEEQPDSSATLLLAIHELLDMRLTLEWPDDERNERPTA